MNEREFLKKLKSKVNSEKDLTPSIVEELLSQGQQLVVRKRINIWAMFFKKKSPSQIIADNFEFILNQTSYFQLDVLLENLIKNWQTAQIVKENFDTIIKRYSRILPEEAEKGAVAGLTKTKFYIMCKEIFDDADEMLKSHIDTIIQEGVSLEEALKLKGLSQETDEKLNAGLESRKAKIARELLEGIPFNKKSQSEKEQLVQDYIPTAQRIIEELLAEQKVRMIDIKRIGKGSYSRVYEIGQKALKIGKTRETYEIPNHPRILQPLTRTNLLDERDNNKAFACIEISDRVDKLKKEDLQVEKLYQLYKELRDDGIIWTDVRFSNVGKLRKENQPTLNGEEMDVDPQAVGMDKKVKGKTLKAGDWVIIDTDFIYKEDAVSKVITDSRYFLVFERRWQQERQGKIVEAYQRNIEYRSQEDRTKSYESRNWEEEEK